MIKMIMIIIIIIIIIIEFVVQTHAAGA